MTDPRHLPVRVLVVDDQPAFRAAARAVVEELRNFVVVAEAVDGVDALDQVARHHPDVVLMDVRMPRLDGIETARRLVDVGTGCTIVLMSSYARQDMAAEPALGSVTWIAKEDLTPESITEAWSRRSLTPGRDVTPGPS